MGNTLRASAKVMKINGETFKLKTPVQAGSVLRKNPGYVLLESESVMHYGVRAKPLEPQQELKPKRLYFLVQLPPKVDDEQDCRGLRRVRSGIHMSAKDRLETLMLARRSSSDLSTAEDGGVRVRMRLPRAELQRLMAESQDGAEAAEKIVGLCMAAGDDAAAQNVHWNGDHESSKRGPKSRERRVGFLPINEREIHYH